jgi:hypothetical protein
MTGKNKKSTYEQPVKIKRLFGKFLACQKKFWISSSKWRKAWLCLLLAAVILISLMYSVAQWFIWNHRNEPLRLGATFIPNYAVQFGLDPQETLDAVINDLGVKKLRLVSYWSDGESVQGKYDFSFLDWQLDMAREANIPVSLAIGLRQPRWPECHMPTWAKDQPKPIWQPALYDYIAATVERYQDDPIIESWQLENEFLLSVFGQCPDHDRQRLIEEFDLVKSIDDSRPIIVNRSNNATPSWPIGQPRADLVGASIYKRVWDGTITKRYFEYPIPAWFYAFLGGMTEITTDRTTFIHELQAEAWPPRGQSIIKTPLEEQDKSMNAVMLKDRFEYGRATGMKEIDLWGVEWWYWRKAKMNDSSLWEVAKQEFSRP